MPLIPYADISKLPDDVRERYERQPRKLNIFRMWANAATCFVPGIRFGGAILSKQKLNPALRELIILLVARMEGGTYEWVQHVPIAKTAGCRDDQIAALEKFRLDDAAFDVKERALLRFSREVIRNVKASEAAVAEMSKHFSPQEMVEAILTCGFYMTMARMTETARVEVDAPPNSAPVVEMERMG
jgi:alkylhydroperoxidase family enzyme